MDINKLVHMANQIGEFFAAMPDRTQALEGLVSHLRKFWDPRMRKQLSAHLEQQGGSGLSPIVLQALKAHRSLLG